MHLYCKCYLRQCNKCAHKLSSELSHHSHEWNPFDTHAPSTATVFAMRQIGNGRRWRRLRLATLRLHRFLCWQLQHVPICIIYYYEKHPRCTARCMCVWLPVKVPKEISRYIYATVNVPWGGGGGQLNSMFQIGSLPMYINNARSGSKCCATPTLQIWYTHGTELVRN